MVTASRVTLDEPEPRAGVGAFRVLIVDDNEADRMLTAIRLGEAWPFEHDLAVEYAGDGAEALDKLRRARFALVVLDWNMPAVGGSEVLRVVRQGGVRVPVVVVSGLNRAELGEDLESLRASFINKNELRPDRFRAAVAASLILLGEESLRERSPRRG